MDKLETIVQQELISAMKLMEKKHPEFALIYSIPNEAKRSPMLADKMKRNGLKSGVPDLCLPIRSKDGKYGSLYLEMKRSSGGVVSQTQKDYHKLLQKYGNRIEVCKDANNALQIIAEHLGIKIDKTVTEIIACP